MLRRPQAVINNNIVYPPGYSYQLPTGRQATPPQQQQQPAASPPVDPNVVITTMGNMFTAVLSIVAQQAAGSNQTNPGTGQPQQVDVNALIAQALANANPAPTGETKEQMANRIASAEGFTPDQTQLTELTNCADEAAMRAKIQQWKTPAPPQPIPPQPAPTPANTGLSAAEKTQIIDDVCLDESFTPTPTQMDELIRDFTDKDWVIAKVQQWKAEAQAAAANSASGKPAGRKKAQKGSSSNL